MAKALLTLNDLDHEYYTTDVHYEYDEDQITSPAVEASVIIFYLIQSGKLYNYTNEALEALKNGQVSNT